MNIIICGAGKVGFAISKQLSDQGHSVTVIDQSSEDIKKINDSQEVKGIVGRATFPSVLENAGAENTDMIIAVTRNDETNMIICQLASSLFNIPKKIARIRSKEFLDPKWSKLYNKSNLPIDVIISPENEVAKSLYRKLEAPGALDNVPFADNKIKVLEISVEKNCPIINIPLKKLTEKFPDLKSNILGAVRKDKFIFLKKKDQLLVDAEDDRRLQRENAARSEKKEADRAAWFAANAAKQAKRASQNAESRTDEFAKIREMELRLLRQQEDKDQKAAGKEKQEKLKRMADLKDRNRVLKQQVDAKRKKRDDQRVKDAKFV